MLCKRWSLSAFNQGKTPMYRKIIMFFFVMVLASTSVVVAQSITPAPDAEDINPNALITWPPPVYALRGSMPIYGTANLPNLSNYFIEFRPLYDEALDGTLSLADDDSPWFPITLPSGVPVVDDVLGTWNTLTTADGLYEIRLTVNVSGQPSQHFVVSPIRVENNVPDFVADLISGGSDDEDGGSSLIVVTATPSTAQGRPTLPAASTTTAETAPRVTANLDVNVRSGDSTLHPVVGSLRNGTTASVIGISSSGTGWYLIRLSSGLEGWVSNSVVTASGDFRSVPRIAPPPPPFTNTPIPTATPIVSANLTGSAPALSPYPPTCNVGFQVLVNITNNGSGATSAPATILFQDVHVASGTVTASFIREVPVLAPGANFVVGNDSVVVSTYFNEEHQLRVIIDPNGVLPETNKGDNVLTTNYTLQQGGC
jgi:hypothetical protein